MRTTYYLHCVVSYLYSQDIIAPFESISGVHEIIFCAHQIYCKLFTFGDVFFFVPFAVESLRLIKYTAKGLNK